MSTEIYELGLDAELVQLGVQPVAHRNDILSPTGIAADTVSWEVKLRQRQRQSGEVDDRRKLASE
jgi:hypothetical protein